MFRFSGLGICGDSEFLGLILGCMGAFLEISGHFRSEGLLQRGNAGFLGLHRTILQRGHPLRFMGYVRIIRV